MGFFSFFSITSLSSSEMLLKLMCFVTLFFSFGLTNAGQEQVTVLSLLSDPTPSVVQTLLPHYNDLSLATSVGSEYLSEISSSVLMAESWVRAHVLTHYPATQITTIVVGETVLCKNGLEDKWDLVLPAVKNIYHSLKRWGLEKEIKVSPAFSAECLNKFSYSFREDLAQRVVKPLLLFLQSSNYTYTVHAPQPNFSPLVSSFVKSIGDLGVFKFSGINVVGMSSQQRKPKMRKLYADPFPARPTPLPLPADTPGFSVPSHIAQSPLPPLIPSTPPPSMTFTFAPQGPLVVPSNPHFAPQSPPLVVPSNPPFAPQSPPSVVPSNPPEGNMYPSNPPEGNMYPPCSHHHAPPVAVTPTPGGRGGEEKGLWCVAKPSVPAEKLHQAMDYACGVGGADCDEIKPHGSCFYPDTMVAHASYAFNSYWQKNKNNGGTCSFGGTAMVINADPSFVHCRFKNS